MTYGISTICRRKCLSVLLSVFIATSPLLGQAELSADSSLNSVQLADQLQALEHQYPKWLRASRIGQTRNGGPLSVLRIGSSDEDKPALLAIFAQHGDEHATTTLALSLVRGLLEDVQYDPAVAQMLADETLYVVPMSNPDGADFDLRRTMGSASWRKNLLLQDQGVSGTDLNRNWGAHWGEAGSSSDSQSTDPSSQNYQGEEAFSEAETRTLRDFAIEHRNIRLFVDYHTGSSNFMQGAVLVPFSYAEAQAYTPECVCYGHLAERFAQQINRPGDQRAPFEALQSAQMRAHVFSSAPFFVKPFVWAKLPASTAAPGAAIDWAASQGICSLGVEILLNTTFDDEERRSLFRAQDKGFRFLLKALREEADGQDNSRVP